MVGAMGPELLAWTPRGHWTIWLVLAVVLLLIARAFYDGLRK